MYSALKRISAAMVTLVVVLLSVASQQGTARGQIIPPPIVCRASITNAGIKAPTTAWIAGPPVGWQYTWSWTVDYDCPNGNFTNCVADVAIESSVYGSDGHAGPNVWDYLCSQNYKTCSTSWQTTYATTFPKVGAVAPGTIFSIAFFAASHDGAIQNCSDQNFQLVASFLYQAPAAP